MVASLPVPLPPRRRNKGGMRAEYMENANGIIKREGSRVRLSGRKYVIRELGNHTVRAFAKKWYTALNNISGRKKLDVDRDFLIPVYKNVNVENLISNPLELASLLMISSYDSYLPSNYAQIYGRSIELWLSWGNISRYNYEDVMRQLSQVAYQMAASENDKIIVSLENLKKYILIKIQIRIIKQIIAMDTLGLHQMEVFNLQ